MASDNTHQDIRSMKRSMTLDLEGGGSLGGSRAKQLKSQFSNAPVLTSPDLNRLALASPEVEQFIKDNIQTVSSSSQATPINVYLCPPKEITDKQAQFAKGFEEALAKVQQNEQRAAKAEPNVISISAALSSSNTATALMRQAGTTAIAAAAATTATTTSTSTTTATNTTATATTSTTTTTSDSTTSSTTAGAAASATAVLSTLVATGTSLPQSTTFTNLTAANLHNLNIQMGTISSNCDLNGSSDGVGSDTSDSMTLKDEQTNITGGSLGPIDMGDQDRMKLERKRMRNRLAASKCRKKKLERISQLEDQVNRLKNDNQEYEKMISLLRNEISSLRQEATLHRQHGCMVDL